MRVMIFSAKRCARKFGNESETCSSHNFLAAPPWTLAGYCQHGSAFFSRHEFEIWACFWPRECFENKGVGDGPPMARATSGGQMQDCCTLCKGSGRFLFRAPQLFNGNLVSGGPADFSDLAPGEQKRSARMWKIVESCTFCKGNRGRHFRNAAIPKGKRTGAQKMLKIPASIATFTAAPSPPPPRTPLSLSLSKKRT